MQMNSLEAVLQKGELLFFLFRLSFHFPLYILPSFTFLHLPSTPVNGGMVVGLKKYEFPHSVNPEESVSQGLGQGCGGCRVLAGPRVSGSPAWYPENQGPCAFWESGRAVRRGKRGMRKEGGPWSPTCSFVGGVPSAVQGDVAAADLPGAQCPF